MDDRYDSGARAYAATTPDTYPPDAYATHTGYEQNPFDPYPPATQNAAPRRPSRPAPLDVGRFIGGEIAVAVLAASCAALATAVLARVLPGHATTVPSVAVAAGGAVFVTLFLATVLVLLLLVTPRAGWYFAGLASVSAAGIVVLPMLSAPFETTWAPALIHALIAAVTVCGTYVTGRATSRIPF